MKKRTVRTRRGSMILDIQRKVTAVAFHTFESFSPQIANFNYNIKQFCFVFWTNKNASVDFGLFVVLSICVGVIHIFYVVWTCSHHAHALVHILHAYLRLFWHSIEHFTVYIDFFLGINWTLKQDLLNMMYWNSRLKISEL